MVAKCDSKTNLFIKKIPFFSIKKTHILMLIANALKKLQKISGEKSNHRKCDREMSFFTLLLSAKVFGL